MIFNTFSITVAQRTRENGLLRALGASRRQVLASVLLEAAGGRRHRRRCSGWRPGSPWPSGLKALLSALGLGLPAGGTGLHRAGRPCLAGWSGSASRCRGHLARAQGGQGAAGRGDAGRDRGQHRLRLQAAHHGRLCRSWRLGWPRCSPACSPTSSSARPGRRRRRAAGLLRRVGAGPDRSSLPLSRAIGAPLPRLRGRHRQAGPRERHAQPQAHRGQRVRADDRGRPGRRSSRSSPPRAKASINATIDRASPGTS